MNLHKTVIKFLTETLTDPYTPGANFKGAVRPFNEVVNSGPATRRRILETLPTTAMFANSVVMHGTTAYVVGGKNVDFWRGQEIRAKYPILPCDLTIKIGSIVQAVSNTLPTKTIYAYPHFVKGVVNDAESPEIESAFYFYLSMAETVTRGQVILQGTKYYRVRKDPHLDGALFQVVDALLLEAPVQSLSYVKAAGYNQVTETIINGVTATVTAFVEDAYTCYDHTSVRFNKLEPGDKNITFVSATAPAPGDTLGAYRVLSVDPVTGGHSCHCRI